MVSFTRGTVAQSMISKYPSGYSLAGAYRLFRCLSGSATQHNHRVVSVPSAPSCRCFCPNLTGFSSRGHSHPHKLAFAEHRLDSEVPSRDVPSTCFIQMPSVKQKGRSYGIGSVQNTLKRFAGKRERPGKIFLPIQGKTIGNSEHVSGLVPELLFQGRQKW